MPAQTVLPRWRGFNLTDLFMGERTARRYPQFVGAFSEDDFRWMRDWGFDFARIPMNYRLWLVDDDPTQINKRVMKSIDRVIRLGEQYGIHISLNFHTAPGYCINKRPGMLFKNLWQEQAALDAFCFHWNMFAARYKGISSDRLSFDLVNEPPPIDPDVMTAADYVRVSTAAVNAIRSEDPDRLIFTDGYNVGRTPCPELADLGVAQSTRGYDPHSLSHYRAPWAGGMDFPLPTWPQTSPELDTRWDRDALVQHYAPWANLAKKGTGVHCGECGCYIFTPHDVFLAWFEDVLDILKGHNIGWALWNLRGDFGILDSKRTGVTHEDWHGHTLDRKLLDLLRRY